MVLEELKYISIIKDAIPKLAFDRLLKYGYSLLLFLM